MSLIASIPVDRMEGPYRRRWWGLLVLCLSLLIVVMANTSLIVAAPDMTLDLGLDSGELQWVIDGYTVPYAALMLVLGAVGDKYSRRGALLTGLAIFGSGSVMGSLVDSADAVIAARAIMGLGAALIMPATLSLLVAMFPRKERVQAITAWAATSGLAIAIGPLLAGWLLEDNSWGSTFLINVPVVVIAIVAALMLVPPSKAHGMGKLDLVGGVLSIVSVAALVYAIIEAPHFGEDVTAVIAAVVAAIGLAVFVWWELRHPSPMLDLSKLRERAVAGATLAVLLFFLAVFGSIYYSTQYLQFVLGDSPLETGVRLLPLAVAVFAGSAVTGWLTPRLGVKITIILGMVLGTIAILLLLGIDSQSGYEDFLATLILLGLAIGLSVSPATDTIMGAFPESELGVAGGTNDTAMELGGSLGIAILGSVLAATYKDELADTVGGQVPAAALEAAKDSIGGAQAAAQHIMTDPAGGVAQGQALLEAANKAFADAISHTSLIGGIILAVGTVAVGLLLPGRRSSTGDSPPTTVDAETADVSVPVPVGK
ncbi:MFS transporter [Streptomyces caniscabiei]|uniref:MFS transporter n=1 Tax=Streptomyces caniscabiei TaxID=2746961 RepID=A0A927KXS8_9ACTN|nr:MFS transporter [Streptomyces caniscabiei]MBD9721657.1 MFS transporter [Streptomyces caniscabiei]MDX3508849.1 MFS transporter [Streptomyces caniscabiei]MDX3717398.1 MFS transporter [Streptomyces caniscabiei]WEO23248.1 MFS transporter [Streptomyces caniscabiei]